MLSRLEFRNSALRNSLPIGMLFILNIVLTGCPDLQSSSTANFEVVAKNLAPTFDELEDVTDFVVQNYSEARSVLNRRTRLVTTTFLVSVENNSDEFPIAGPVYAVFEPNSSAATFSGATGTTIEGHSYYDISSLLGDSMLSPLEQVQFQVTVTYPMSTRLSLNLAIWGEFSEALLYLLDITPTEIVDAYANVPTVDLDILDAVLWTGEPVTDYLPDELLDKSSVSDISTKDLTPQERRKELLALMLYNAYDYAGYIPTPTGSLWVFGNQGVDKPAQNRLAYVYGAKYPFKRTWSSKCKLYLHSLDCSGLVYRSAVMRGNIPFSKDIDHSNADALMSIENWNAKIPEAWGLRFKKLEPGEPLQSGDLIGFLEKPGSKKKYSHIAMIAEDRGGAVYVVDSASGGSCLLDQTKGGPASRRLDDVEDVWSNRDVIRLAVVESEVFFSVPVDDYLEIYIDGELTGSWDAYLEGHFYDEITDSWALYPYDIIQFHSTLTVGWHDIRIVYMNRFGDARLGLMNMYSGEPGLFVVPKEELRWKDEAGNWSPGLRADYYNLDGTHTRTILGEGPIDHGWDGVYQGQSGSWGGYDVHFGENLTGQIRINKVGD